MMSQPINNRLNLKDMNVRELMSSVVDNPPDEVFRQMVEFELMARTGEEIDYGELSGLIQIIRDKKILPFPRFTADWRC